MLAAGAWGGDSRWSRHIKQYQITETIYLEKKKRKATKTVNTEAKGLDSIFANLMQVKL